MRVLVPLLVLLVLAGLLVRVQGRPSREVEEGWIELQWSIAPHRPAAVPSLLADLERHLAAHGEDPEARWFCARGFLKAGFPERALEVVWEEGPLAEAPGTARRFGTLLLRTLGFEDDVGLHRPRPLSVQCLVALAEGGDRQAWSRLEEAIAGMRAGLLTTFLPFFASATRPHLERFAALVRARDEDPAHVIAALAVLGPEPYPERAQDLERLLDVLAGPLRRQEALVWAMAALALGRSGDERALLRMEAMRGRLDASGDESDRHDAGTLAAALVAGGRWEAWEGLGPYLGPRAAGSPNRHFLVVAVLHRLARGDPEAPRHVLEVWDSLRRHRDPPLRARLGNDLFLRDMEPPGTLPLEDVLADLAVPPSGPGEQSVAVAWRLRSEGRRATWEVVDFLRRLVAGGWFDLGPSVVNPMVLAPSVRIARALYLYDDGSSGH